MKSIVFLVFILFIAAFNPKSERIESRVYSFIKTNPEKTMQGEKRLMFGGETTHMKNFEALAITLHPGAVSERETKNRNFEGIVFVKEGSLKIAFENKSAVVGPGSVILFMPEEALAIENNGDKPATYFLVQYDSKSHVNTSRGLSSGGSAIIDWQKLEFQPHDRGGLRKFFDRKSAMSERIEMHATTLNPAIKSHEPHTHAPDEIVIMMSGKTEMEIGNNIYPGEAGDIYFLGSNIPHAIRNTGSQPCSYLAFQWE